MTRRRGCPGQARADDFSVSFRLHDARCFGMQAACSMRWCSPAGVTAVTGRAAFTRRARPGWGWRPSSWWGQAPARVPRCTRCSGARSAASPPELDDVAEMHAVLLASSGAPPFIPATDVKGAPAFDGGLVDNVPVEPLAPIEAAGGRTLVLLTRVYKDVPAVAGRTYVQPSEKINLSQFDITNPDGIRAAYELGLRDGAAF